MPAAAELVCHGRMALAAHVADPVHARRSRPMVAVAIVARGRRQLPLHGHHTPVNALLVLPELVRWNPVPPHPRSVGVARAAGGRDVQRMDARLRVRRGTYLVRVMAAGAG